MSIENLFGEGHDVAALEQEITDQAEAEVTEDNLFWVVIASVMYCPAAIASIAVAC